MLFLKSVTLNKAREFERRPTEEDEGRQLSASLAGDYTFDSDLTEQLNFSKVDLGHTF